MAETEVLIAGGGIIGLSIALELASRGLRVTVLERGQAMREASWAAAGMLAADDPENPCALKPLADLSIRLYGSFLKRVEELSGLPVPLRTSRTLQYGHDRERRWLDEHSLDPRDLCAALPGAAFAAGVKLMEDVEAITVEAGNDGVIVETSAGSIGAEYLVSCCGPWGGPSGDLPVFPLKGQMALCRLPHESVLDHVIRTPDIYLVPRGDGRVVIGATVERAGFDKTVEPPVIDQLMASAAQLWPGIRQARLIESWAGLRPATEDGLPMIGTCGPQRCLVATGHFRNGILLAPATAHLIAQIVSGEPPEIDLGPFRCDRFAVANVH